MKRSVDLTGLKREPLKAPEPRPRPGSTPKATVTSKGREIDIEEELGGMVERLLETCKTAGIIDDAYDEPLADVLEDEITEEPGDEDLVDLAAKWVAADSALKRVREAEKRAKEERDAIGDRLFSAFETTGCRGIRVLGKLVYPMVRRFVGIKKNLCFDNKGKVVEIAEALGLPISINTQSLSSIVKEYEDRGDSLPDWILESMDAHDSLSIGARKHR